MRRFPSTKQIVIAFATVAGVGLLLSLIPGVFSPRKIGTLGEWLALAATLLAVVIALEGRRVDALAAREANARCVVISGR